MGGKGICWHRRIAGRAAFHRMMEKEGRRIGFCGMSKDHRGSKSMYRLLVTQWALTQLCKGCWKLNEHLHNSVMAVGDSMGTSTSREVHFEVHGALP
jgi:hypothetical protein